MKTKNDKMSVMANQRTVTWILWFWRVTFKLISFPL